MNREARLRSRRRRQLWVAAGLLLAVGVVGQVIVWLPEKVEFQKQTAQALPASAPEQVVKKDISESVKRAPVEIPDLVPAETDRAGHVRTAREREVAQRFDQAVSMLHMRQYDYAMSALHRVLELSPKMPEAHVNMGYALLGLEKYESAYDFFETATVLRPTQTNAYYGMALALKGLGAIKAAIEAMETYLHLEKTNPDHIVQARQTVAAWRQEHVEQYTREAEVAVARAAQSGNPSSGDEQPQSPEDVATAEGAALKDRDAEQSESH